MAARLVAAAYLLALLLTAHCAQAQHHDANWVVGYPWLTPPSGVVLNFMGSPSPQIVDSIPQIKIKFATLNLSMSDSSGALQFYSNGITVWQLPAGVADTETDLSPLPAGMYLLQASDGQATQACTIHLRP